MYTAWVKVFMVHKGNINRGGVVITHNYYYTNTKSILLKEEKNAEENKKGIYTKRATLMDSPSTYSALSISFSITLYTLLIVSEI